MSEIIIQQFNPTNKYWNTIHKIDSADYDEETFVPINKYGGPYRVLGLADPKKVLDFSKEAVVESIELEEEDESIDYVEPKSSSKSSKKTTKKYSDEWN